jgi:type III pantothenate kinase
MNVLIGDIGNTKTKISLVETKNFRIKKMVSFDSIKILSKNNLNNEFNNFIKKNNVNRVALFSSVVPKYELIIKKYLINNYNIKLREIKEKGIKKIVKLNIKNVNQVGSDRIANAVGAYKMYKENCIILDFGTATTFDVVKKNGTYKGGIIAPGINLAIKSLVKSADQIPFFKVKKEKKIIGKNTLSALRSGFYWGYTGLINNIIMKIEEDTKIKYKIIFTGGYADVFKSSIKKPLIIDRNITIKGIVEIYKVNINQLN